MKPVTLIAMTLFISACSSTVKPIHKPTYVGEFDFRLSAPGKTNADGKTAADLKPTNKREFQSGPNAAGSSNYNDIKQREDLNKPIGNDAQIKIINRYPFNNCKYNFTMDVSAKIDGKIIKPRPSGKGSRVSPGKHNLSVSLTAIYEHNAKHNSTRNYEIFLKSRDVVVITPRVPVKQLEAIHQDAEAFIRISGPNININEKIILKNDSSKDPKCNNAIY